MQKQRAPHKSLLSSHGSEIHLTENVKIIHTNNNKVVFKLKKKVSNGMRGITLNAQLQVEPAAYFSACASENPYDQTWRLKYWETTNPPPNSAMTKTSPRNQLTLPQIQSSKIPYGTTLTCFQE